MQSVPGSKNPQTPNKNQKTNPGPVVTNAGAGAKRVPTSSSRIFDPSEYPAMPSKIQASNIEARANNPIAISEVAQSLEQELPEDTINASKPLTPDSRLDSSTSIGSEQSFEVKQPPPGDIGDKEDLAADTSTIISESETSDTPEPSSHSALAESEKTIDDFHDLSSSSQENEPLDDNSVGTEAVEQPEGSLPVDQNDETPEGSVGSIDDILLDQQPSNEVVQSISADSPQITANIQKIEQVSTLAESEAMTTNNVKQEEDPGNGKKVVDDHQHEAHDEVPAFENSDVGSTTRDLGTVTNQPSFNSTPAFNNSIPPNYPFHHQLGGDSLHHNANLAHPPPPPPFYHPLSGMPVGIIPPYTGAIPPGLLPYQPYNAGPQLHPSQLPPFPNHTIAGFNENSQPMPFGHLASPDATIHHPGETQPGSLPQIVPYSPLEVPNSENMEVESADEAVDEPQPATPDSAFRCSYCRDPTPTDGRTLVFCPGCGPTCNIRYCSTACLLADSYDHSTRCMNFPASQRLAFHNLPVQFIYEQEPIMPISGLPQSPEQFRQKAYMMYCHSGPFPATLQAWARRNSAESSLQGIDILERQKRTGNYHVFRSALTAVGPRCNAGADVVFVGDIT